MQLTLVKIGAKARNWPCNNHPLTGGEYVLPWRTWQMSDHLLLWIELQFDFTDDWLRLILGRGVVQSRDSCTTHCKFALMR